MTPVFGRTVLVMAAVYEWAKCSKTVQSNINQALRRFASADWGDLDMEDAAVNDAALEVGGRLVASYSFLGKKVWIITEADRSATTILFPDDY